MSEIPEDIQKVAANIVANWLLQPSAEPYVVAISAALLAERERCAKIAASIQAPKSIGRDHGRHHMAGAQAASRAILAQRQP